MIKGTTVIFNEDYISEIERHISATEQNIASEVTPDKRVVLMKKLDNLNNKLEEALEFQDCVDEILDMDTPRLTVLKTITGKVLPLRIVKII